MDHYKQLDILDPRLLIYPITVIGCGGIGSPTALLLAKEGYPNIKLFDPDIVEQGNIANQFFRNIDEGMIKVEALRCIIEEFAESSIEIIPHAFNGQVNVSGIVISAVDTMEKIDFNWGRREIWERIKFNIKIPLYIDGRIGGEILEIYTIQPSKIADIEFYENSLFSQKEAAPLPCTARAIMHTGFIIAGLIASQLKKWIKQETYYRRVNFDLKTMTSIFQ